MRLVNLGAGEISDRLTILSLKVLHAGAAGQDTAHFLNERSALLAQIRTRTLNGSWFDKVLELAAINGALWQAENEIREWRAPKQAYGPPDLDRIRQVAFSIQALNDQRAALIDAINQESGEHLGKEKV